MALSIITLIITTTVLSYYLSRLKELERKDKEAANIINIIINEIRNRMNMQDKKIIDQIVRLDILEIKFSKHNQYLSETSRKFSEETRENMKTIITNSQIKLNKKKSLTSTEEEILNLLSKKERTAKELQALINKTREHTSRILKKLFDDGYIIRNKEKKPFTYRLIR